MGRPFELAGLTVDGSPLQWSDYRNKVVLVNFWATWSLPSVTELSQLKRYYESYRDAGFEIVGVSLDQNRADLQAVLAKEQIPWPNLFQEGTGAEHPMALKYGVRAIPSSFLIDGQGNVVSTRARGVELERLLEHSFGPESVAARELAADSRWPEAAKELERLIAEHPSNVDYRLALGAIQLLGDDTLGYSGTCQSSWTAMNQNRSADPAGMIPLFCLPGDHSLDRNEVYEIATSVRDKSDSNLAKLAIVMSAFRSGRDDVCLNEQIVDGDAFTISVAALTKAMSAHRAGEFDQAETFLTEGRGVVALRFGDYLGPAAQGFPTSIGSAARSPN